MISATGKYKGIKILWPEEHSMQSFSSHFCKDCENYHLSWNETKKASDCVQCQKKQEEYYKSGNPIEVSKDENGRKVARLV